MAGKRESLERNAIQDVSRVASAQQNNGDSMQRGLYHSGNIHAPNKTEACIMESENIKAEEVGNSNSKAHLSATRMQNSTSRAGEENHQQTYQSSPNQRINGQNTQEPQTQGPGAGDQNQNYATGPASPGLIGIIPPRELNAGPRDNEDDNTPNYRRMAVCQETDDAVDQRTKMRVYMKRF